MKKHLLTALLSLTFAFTLAGVVGCGKDDSSAGSSESSSTNSSTDIESSEDISSETESSEDVSSEDVSSETDSSEEESSEAPAVPCTVTFEEGEGYSFSSNIQSGEEILSGKTLIFNVNVGGLYTGEPLVYVNEKPTAMATDGKYYVTVTENTVIRVTGVRKDVSMMEGTGSMDSPFVVSKPIDLLYIAEQVNAGNRTYATGAYILKNDIDCKGAELQVIGNDPDNDKFFSGCFVSNYGEDGASYRYTISNFTINTEGTNYVGLFGAVFADLSVESSGFFYGINLENFEINANMYTTSSATQTIACGSLVGYGVGTTIYLCGASNGEINISGDSGYFSFIGGLIGYQQGYYFSEYGESAPSEISYAYADVDINVLSGLVLSAGGISGYLATNYPFGAVASIHNSYSTGNISGAIRAGGIAGALGQYTSVSNCYATGLISANSNQNNSNPLWKNSEYCIAHAGGIVGFAENDSIVHDSFFGGEAEATAVTNDELAIAGEASPNNNFAFANFGVGGGYDEATITADSKKYVELNCLSTKDVDLADKDCFKTALSWQDYDWIFTANEYPQLNYAATSEHITLQMNLQYVEPNSAEAVSVEGKTNLSHTYFDNTVESASFYVPMGNFFATGALDFYYTADNGYLSYGYFFDEACTQPVPYAYMPAKNITLYVAFADPTPLVGEYYYTADNGNLLKIEFYDNGTVLYTDGNSEQKTTYSFDGENILIDGARLARYYLGNVIVDDTNTSIFADPNFDLSRYYYYNFAGTLTETGINLYDGVYFTEENPLTASKTQPQIEKLDSIVGSWIQSATVNNVFTFDKDGTWTFTRTAYNRTQNNFTSEVKESISGTYIYSDGVYTLTYDGGTATATFENGYLCIVADEASFTLAREGSYTGIWKGDNFSISFNGIGANGTGTALLTYEDESTLDLVYEAAETAGYTAIYLPDTQYWKGDLFGYFYYDLRTNVISAVLSDAASETGFTACTLYVLDDYYGEWITVSEDFGDAEFIFDGMGLYSHLGYTGKFKLIKDGVTETIEYTLDSLLNGTFYYDSQEWSISFNFTNNNVSITPKTDLERKDVFANVQYVDKNGNHYLFNGKGNLSIGGKLTVNNQTEYFYKYDGACYLVYNNLSESSIGTITFVDNYLSLLINGVENKLYIKNDFMGSWAISNAFATFEIGPTDTNGLIAATYRGIDVTISYLDTNLLTFSFHEASGLPMTYYVFVIFDESTNENVLVLSEYTNLLGSYIVCSRSNEMFGTWTSANGLSSITFDGVTSGYQNGVAVLSKDLAGDTYYYYTIKEDGIIMWSQDLMQGRTRYYRIDLLDDTSATGNSVFFKDGKAFMRTEVDGLCFTRATDTETGEEYLFDGGCVNEGNGGIWVGDTKKYEYTFIAYNVDNTATLTVIDLATGKTHEATLNYKDQKNITFTLGEEIASESETV
ncbi:MAG: hypothetical protein IJV83_01480 [Clostridia bacterium]|nr:hypothetical protein [Clostridia bacterium]